MQVDILGSGRDQGRNAAGLLLAAGLSSRMGRPKPLLPYGGVALIVYQVQQLLAAGLSPVVVVTGHEAALVEREIAGLPVRIVQNPLYQEGRSTSVRAGAEALRPSAPSIDALVVLNVDQPRPPGLIVRAVVQHRQLGGLITRPLHQGRGGHPTIFSITLLPELCSVEEQSQGLRAVLLRHGAQVREYDEPDPRIVLDLNNPEAYESALRSMEQDQPHERVMTSCRHSDV